MVPGMGHCAGGEGPDTFDKIGMIEQWVEHGQAPAQIVASHRTAGKIDRTRPLCPYPEVARYRGSGSIDDAVNFLCAAPHWTDNRIAWRAALRCSVWPGSPMCASAER
jgi:feruloyl esterase